MKLLWGLFGKAKQVAKTIYVQPSTEHQFSGGIGNVHYIFADTGSLLVTIDGQDGDFEVESNGRIIANTRIAA